MIGYCPKCESSILYLYEVRELFPIMSCDNCGYKDQIQCFLTERELKINKILRTDQSSKKD